MPSRPYWKGYMRLSRVSFAVALYPVIASTGSDAEITSADIVKGYEYEKDRYVVVDDDDLAKIRLETTKTIELIQFFKAAEIDPIYYDKPYYLVPDGVIAEEAYAVLREALARSGQAALGRVVLSGRERLTVILPRDKGFVLHTLHATDLVRKPASYFAEIDTEVGPDLADEVEVAEHLIARKTARFDPRRFVDRYEEALRGLIEEKLKGQSPRVVEAAPVPAGNVIDLMDALKRSLGEGTEGAARREA